MKLWNLVARKSVQIIFEPFSYSLQPLNVDCIWPRCCGHGTKSVSARGLVWNAVFDSVCCWPMSDRSFTPSLPVVLKTVTMAMQSSSHTNTPHPNAPQGGLCQCCEGLNRTQNHNQTSASWLYRDVLLKTACREEEGRKEAERREGKKKSMLFVTVIPVSISVFNIPDITYEIILLDDSSTLSSIHFICDISPITSGE